MKLLFFAIIALHPLWFVQAEVFACAGVWTNRLCEGLSIAPSESSVDTDPASKEKARIISDIERFSRKVQTELGRTDFEADGTRDFCTKAQVTVEECRARALRADKSLMSSLQAFARIRQRGIELAQKQQEIGLRRERLLREVRKTGILRRTGGN